MRTARKQKSARAIKRAAKTKVFGLLKTYYAQDAQRITIISGHRGVSIGYGSPKYDAQEIVFYVKNPRAEIAKLAKKAQERPRCACFTSSRTHPLAVHLANDMSNAQC